MIGNLVGQMGIDTGSCDASMSQDFLYDTDINTAFKEMVAYSDPIRPPFRPESGHYSDGKAAGIPF
jgi:hypothetical protein